MEFFYSTQFICDEITYRSKSWNDSGYRYAEYVLKLLLKMMEKSILWRLGKKAILNDWKLHRLQKRKKNRIFKWVLSCEKKHIETHWKEMTNEVILEIITLKIFKCIFSVQHSIFCLICNHHYIPFLDTVHRK